MSILPHHEITYFGREFGKTEILYLVIATRKSAWSRFPAYSEFSNLTSNLHFKGFSSLLFIS